MRKYPENLIKFLREVEGVRLKSYQDSKGIWTIGVGHTGPEVKQNMTITQSKVDEYLDEDIGDAMRDLYRSIKSETIDKLTDNQYAALLSFCFNLGTDTRWGFWKAVDSCDWDKVPPYMMRFVNAKVNGVTTKLPGLVNRRAKEVILWNTPDEKKTPEKAPPSSEIRAADTPPTPAPETRPLFEQKPVITGIGAAAASVPTAVNKIIETVSPYAKLSPKVGDMLQWLGVAGAVLSVAVLVFLYLRDRRLKRDV